MNSRFDKIDHWPKIDGKKSRSLCKHPNCSNLTFVVCTKCKVNLCFTTKRNCFLSYHCDESNTKRSKKDNNKKTKQNNSKQTEKFVRPQNTKTNRKMEEKSRGGLAARKSVQGKLYFMRMLNLNKAVRHSERGSKTHDYNKMIKVR